MPATFYYPLVMGDDGLPQEAELETVIIVDLPFANDESLTEETWSGSGISPEYTKIDYTTITVFPAGRYMVDFTYSWKTSAAGKVIKITIDINNGDKTYVQERDSYLNNKYDDKAYWIFYDNPMTQAINFKLKWQKTDSSTYSVGIQDCRVSIAYKGVTPTP